MTRYSTVLFDLDGTLIDSVDLIIDSYQHTFRTHGLRAHSREEILAGIGTPLRTVFGALGASAEEMATWIATYREFNLAHHDARVRAYPGAVEMVRALHAGGRRLGLVTSKNRAGALRGLALVGLHEVMEVIVGADDVEHPKPHPEPVQRALTTLGVSTEGAIFIGDSVHDLHSGRAAGVTTMGITWGPFAHADLVGAGPDHCCASPAEVLGVLGL